MIREIVSYGHPALRAKGRRIAEVDERTRQLAADMIETMNEASGVGLAAQQVGLPLQLCVLDTRDVPERPSQMWIDGQKVDPDAHMPLVLVNPEIETSGAGEVGVEGCLSFPGISADVERPAKVKVRAEDLEGRAILFEAKGLLSRAVQHEFDHLQGILFIDRMSPKERQRIDPEVRALLGQLL